MNKVDVLQKAIEKDLQDWNNKKIEEILEEAKRSEDPYLRLFANAWD